MPSILATSICVMCCSSMMSAIWLTRLALIWCSSGEGNPRSAKTLPLPWVTASSLFIASCSHILSYSRQSRFSGGLNQVHVRQRRGNPFLGFLLEDMQHVDGQGKLYGIYGSIGIAIVALYNFQDTCPAEPAQRFGALIANAFLRPIRSIAEAILDLFRKCSQIVK